MSLWSVFGCVWTHPWFVELVAEGRSNEGIGERLVITERAVQKHVTEPS